jgi:hypothetical protein
MVVDDHIFWRQASMADSARMRIREPLECVAYRRYGLLGA